MKTIYSNNGTKQSQRSLSSATPIAYSAPKIAAKHKPTETHNHCPEKPPIDPNRTLLNAQLLKEHGHKIPRVISPDEEGEEFARNERIGMLEARKRAILSILDKMKTLGCPDERITRVSCYVGIGFLGALCAYNAHTFALTHTQSGGTAAGFCIILPLIGLLFQGKESALASRVIKLSGFLAATTYLTGFAMTFVNERELDDLSGSGFWKLMLFAGQVGLEISLIHVLHGHIKRIERTKLFPDSTGIVAEERARLETEIESLDEQRIPLKKASFTYDIEKSKAEQLINSL